MYGQKYALGVPASSLGLMLNSVWMAFAAITMVFMAISIWQLIRPAGNHPRP